ncbi:MAG TPA: hypothetical protein VIK08_02460 [Candidatus Limnocylindrales bacterium]
MTEVAPAPHPTALKLQILTAEHGSLIASRGLAWNESFSRASMFLSTLSGAIFALGLVAGIDHFGEVFVAFSLVVLPLVLFVGVSTFVRMGAANYHDATAVLGMNRIRGAYVELVPEIERYLVASAHDDPAGIALTMALPPGGSALVHVVSATPFVVNVLNSAVAGAIGAIVAGGVLGWGIALVVLVAALAFVVALVLQLRLVAANMRRGQRSVRAVFPGPKPPVRA